MRSERRILADLAQLLADQSGEFQRRDLIPEVVDIINSRGVTQEELVEIVALQLLDRAEKNTRERDGRPMFPRLFDLPSEEIVALGGGQRIKRRDMNLDHLDRRERVIDNEFDASQQAYRREKDWLRECRTRLRRRIPGTTVASLL